MEKMELIRQIKQCYANMGKNIGTTYLMGFSWFELTKMLEGLLNCDSAAEMQGKK